MIEWYCATCGHGWIDAKDSTIECPHCKEQNIGWKSDLETLSK